MDKRVAVIGIVVVLVLPLVGLLTRADPAKPVEAQPAALRALAPVILASGSLVYENQVTLGPELLAKVEKVLGKEGDQVSAGQLLMRLDAEAIKAELSRLDSSRRGAVIDMQRRTDSAALQGDRLSRYDVLRREGMIESIKFDEINNQKRSADLDLMGAKEAVRQIEFQIREAQQRLAQTEIRSPIDGRIINVGIKAGETAIPSAGGVPGSVLFVIAQTDGMIADVDIDEADIVRVRVGQRARIVPAGASQDGADSSVEQIAMASRSVAGQGKVFPVKLRLTREQAHRFRAGTTCRAELFLGEGAAPVLAVPLQALRYEDGQKNGGDQKASLFVMSGGQAHQRNVELGLSDDASVQVTKGLALGDSVITGPFKTLRFLHDGDPVVLAGPDAAEHRTAAASSAGAR